MSATFSKLDPQSLASTLAGVGAGECGTSLAYILNKENGSVADMVHHPHGSMTRIMAPPKLHYLVQQARGSQEASEHFLSLSQPLKKEV